MIESVQDKECGLVTCACSSVVERFSDKEEVDGSIPSRRTNRRIKIFKLKVGRCKPSTPGRCRFSSTTEKGKKRQVVY